MFPHLRRAGPITYVGGYRFAGVPMGTRLGRKAALGVLGSPEAATVFSESVPCRCIAAAPGSCRR